MVGCVFGWLFGCWDGCWGWLVAQLNLFKNSLNLWHKIIYVKFRQIYGTKIFMLNFGKFMAQKYLCQISADLCQNCIYLNKKDRIFQKKQFWQKKK
jgi:hypothetical protein